MNTKEDILEIVKEHRENATTGIFEISEENMETLRDIFDNHKEIFCPIEDTTFEQFCGYMLVAGTNFMQRKFVEFSMKQVFDKLLKQ